MASARNYLPRANIAPPALAWLDRAFVAGRLSRADVVLAGPMQTLPVSRRQRRVPRALRHRGNDPRLRRGLAARGKCRGSGGISQRGNDRAVGVGAHRRSGGGSGRRALCRFQDRRAGNSYRCERRRGRRSWVPALNAARCICGTRVLERRSQGLDAVEGEPVSAVQGFRPSARAGARALGRRDAQPAGLERCRDRLERRFRHRWGAGEPRRSSRPRAGRGFSDAGQGAAQSGGRTGPSSSFAAR